MPKPEGRKRVEVHVNVENEQLVLSAMMHDAVVMRDLAASLASKSFIAERHQVIFSVLQDIVHRRLKFDIELFTQLAKTRKYGGREYVEKLYLAFPTLPKNLDYHVERIQVDAVKYELRTGLLQQMVDLAEDPAAGIDDMSAVIREVNMRLAGHLTAGITGGRNLYEKYLADMRARRKSSSFSPTGYDWLDEDLVEGLARKKVSILTARPSIGKSTFAWNIADRVANVYKQKVIYFALEMDMISVLDGIVASRTQIPIDNLVKYPDRLTRVQLRKVNETIYEITNNETLVFWDKGMNLDRLARVLSEGQYALGVFDLYEKMIGTKDQAVIAASLDKTQQMMKDCDCHGMLVHQTRRGVENRRDKRPTLEDLKNSGGYEEVADLVIALYREAYYNEDEPEDVLEVGILKQRRGARLAWHYFDFDGSIGYVGAEVRDWAGRARSFQ